MIRYYLKEEKGVLILSNNSHKKIAFYHAEYGRKELNIKENELKEKGIIIIYE